VIGRSLGDFVLREKLADGGFGEIYRAEQPRLAREAVVKVLRARLEARDAVRVAFVREVQLASRLDHPFAAHVYDCRVEADGLLWIAMELVRGTPLSVYLGQHGRFTPEALAPLLDRICQVVQTAHQTGIVHRDIKPSNVMVIERAGELLPKLLDFGIARAPGDRGGDDGTAPAGGPARAGGGDATRTLWQTLAGVMVGSPPYMAPEQWQDDSVVAPTTDLYALGVLAYECLTGRPPFTGSIEELSRAHALDPVPALGPSFPRALDDFFERALAKLPEHRFASALELGEAFRAAALGRLTTGERVSIEARFAGAEDAWMAAPTARLLARHLDERQLRVRVVDDPAQASVVVRVEGRRHDAGIELAGEVRPAGRRPTPLAPVRGPSVADALASLAEAILVEVGAGREDRGPDDEERAAMARARAPSFAAWRRYRELADAYTREMFVDVAALQERGRELVTQHPTWPRAHALLTLMLGVQAPAAVEVLERGLAVCDADRDPGSRAMLEGLRAYAGGEPAIGAACFERALAETPEDHLCAWVLGALLFMGQRLDESIAIREELARRRPDLQYTTDLAPVLRQAGREDEVTPLYERWAREAPEAPQALLCSVTVELERSGREHAERLLREAVLLHGEPMHRLATLCDLWLALGQTREARRLATRLLRGSDFDRARGHYRLGIAAVLEGRLAAAYESFDAGLARARDQGSANEEVQLRESLRELAVLLGRVDDARRLTVEQAATFRGIGMLAWTAVFELEDALLANGASRPSLEELIARVPAGTARHTAEAHLLRVAAAAGLASHADAVRAGLSAEERSSLSLYRLGASALEEGALRLARTAFTEAAKISLRSVHLGYDLPAHAHSVLARFQLGRTLERLGETAAARDAYAGFLRLWEHADRPMPEVEAARAALLRL